MIMSITVQAALARSLAHVYVLWGMQQDDGNVQGATICL